MRISQIKIMPNPADTIFEVSSLFSADVLIEIEAIVVADEVENWAGNL